MSHDAKKPAGTARRVRWDRGQIRWTERDIALLLWVGEQYAVRFDQLQALLGRQPLGPTREVGQVKTSAVRRCLERWRQARVARYASLLAGEPGWVWLTQKGLRLAGLEYPLWEPGLSFLDHLFACNQARLWVEAYEPEAEWRSERALRAEQAWSEAGVRQAPVPAQKWPSTRRRSRWRWRRP